MWAKTQKLNAEETEGIYEDTSRASMKPIWCL